MTQSVIQPIEFPTANGAYRATRIAFVQAGWHAEIVGQAHKGFVAEMEKLGFPASVIDNFQVPGALEIPGAIRLAIEAQRQDKLKKPFDGYLALGCVIRGETTHYESVCNESARGLTELGIQYAACIGNGILTVENDDQAWTRARVTEKDKGGGAAEAVLALIAIRKKLGLST